jgi:hypothetical protein
VRKYNELIYEVNINEVLLSFVLKNRQFLKKNCEYPFIGTPILNTPILSTCHLGT